MDDAEPGPGNDAVAIARSHIASGDFDAADPGEVEAAGIDSANLGIDAIEIAVDISKINGNSAGEQAERIEAAILYQ